MNKFITIINFNKNNKLIKVYILNNNLIVGKCSSSIQNNVGNIHIISRFRNKYFGNKLLKKTEDIIKTNFNVSQINILVWEKMNTDLIKFYTQNNYKFLENNGVYDDGINLYDLINVKKVV